MERKLIESDTLAAMIEKQIRDAVDRSVEGYIEQTIAQLTLDPAWIEKVENLVNQNFQRRFNERLSLVDVNSLIRDNIDAGIDRFREKLLADFNSDGIKDLAQQIELTVMDQAVVVENQLATRELSVEENTKVKGTLDVNNLCVRGTINTDNRSWDELAQRAADQALASMTEVWINELVTRVLDRARENGGIDFNSVRIDGDTLVEGNRLGSHITESNIQSTGPLRELSVAGHTQLNETVTVNRRRVGINTEDPEMALSVWDEEVSIVAGKIKQQTAYLGTSRLSNLAIGVNRVPQIEIDIEGLTTIKQLRLGQHRISHDREIPGYSGTRGDIVFNSDPKPDTPFAWVCLGGFKWQPLKSA